jgi:hypothetical protein
MHRNTRPTAITPSDYRGIRVLIVTAHYVLYLTCYQFEPLTIYPQSIVGWIQSYNLTMLNADVFLLIF